MKYFFLLTTLLLVPLQAASQKSFSDAFKYKATYQLTYQPDSTDANSVRSEAMTLYLGDEISRFSSLGTAVGDSLMANRDRSNKSMAALARLRSQTPETKFDYYVYKGIPRGELSYTRKILKDNFRYVQDLGLLNWEIEPETKEVAGYKAQKATTAFAGRDYIAWFTAEIPIPDGPHKFNGLPGLIVELRDQENHYSFVLTEFKELEAIPFDFDVKEYITTNKSKFQDVVEKYNSNPLAALEQHGITIEFSPGQKERLEKERKEQLRKENNPLELE